MVNFKGGEFTFDWMDQSLVPVCQDESGIASPFYSENTISK